MKAMSTFYHIVDRDEWHRAQAQGSYCPESLASEGFIHCSYASQVLMPANLLYRGKGNLVLLHIDPSRVSSPVRYDPVAVLRAGIPSEEVFPHIYGPLNVGAVVAVIDFPPDEDGRFSLPPELRTKSADL